MKLSKMGKRIIAVTMAAAVVVSGIVFSPDKKIKAADPEPQVKVLGATILKDEVTDGSKQSMRLAIQVANASYAEMCGIEVKVDGSTKAPVLISTDNADQRKIYSRHENLDIVVYTVLVKDIPSTFFDKKISFKGVVKKLKNDSVYTDTTEYADRTVTGVKEAIEESLDPVAEKKVNLAETNLAYSSKKSFIDNGDGTVTIELERASGGLSVGYYINDNKSPINLNDYSKMVLNITSTADQTGTYSIGFGGPYVSNDYWTNNDLKTALGYGIAFNEGTHDYTYTSDVWNGWNASKKTQSVVYIQAKGDDSGESNTFTLNSITLYKNEDAAKEDPSATPVPTPRPVTPTAEAPTGEGWTKIDLTSLKANNGNSYFSDSQSLVLRDADYVEFPLGAEYTKEQNIKVYLTGVSHEDNQKFRMWSGGRWNSRVSEIASKSTGSKGNAFVLEMTLMPNNPEKDIFDSITIASDGANIADLEITSMYYKPITIGAKPTLAPGELDLSTCNNVGNAGGYDVETGNVVIDNKSGTNQYFFNLPENIASGETSTITVKGIYNGTNGFRVWLGNGWNSFVPSPHILNASDFAKGKEFEKTFDLTANSECTMLTIKSIGSDPINGLTITQIIVTKKQS